MTLLFSSEQYLAAAEAFLRGIERRIEGGLKPEFGSVASIFVSRWDAAVAQRVPEALHNPLAAPFTVNTMPEATLRALADHGSVGALVPTDGGDAEQVLAGFTEAGVDLDALVEQLQRDGAGSLVKSWHSLLEGIASRSAALKAASA